MTRSRPSAPRTKHLQNGAGAAPIVLGKAGRPAHLARVMRQPKCVLGGPGRRDDSEQGGVRPGRPILADTFRPGAPVGSS